VSPKPMYEGYRPAAKWLHWLTALAILTTIPLGIAMVNAAPGPTQNSLYDLHRSFGALVLALAAVRLAVRLLKGAPAPHPALGPLLRALSLTVHRALYVLIVLVPLLGWAGTSAFGAQITVFGLFVLPPILPKDEALSALLLSLHKLAAFTLAALAALHIGAGLWHGFVRRDGVLERMLPTRRTDPPMAGREDRRGQ